MVTHTGSGLVFGGQPRPYPKGVWAWMTKSSQFCGFLLFMCTPFAAELSPISGVLLYLWLHSIKNNQIGHGNTYQSGACFRWSPMPFIPRRRSPSGPQFCGFSATYAYTVQPRTTKFGVVTQIGWSVFRSAMPLHLYKCVVRFVSNSRVYCTSMICVIVIA